MSAGYAYVHVHVRMGKGPWEQVCCPFMFGSCHFLSGSPNFDCITLYIIVVDKSINLLVVTFEFS